MDYNYYYKPEDGVNNIMMWWPDDIYRMSDFDDFKTEQGQDANSIADYNRHISQNAARSKVSCEDLFFLNTLFEEVEEKVLGNLPTQFHLLSPNNETLNESEVLFSWESSFSTTSTIDHYEIWLNCSLVATVPVETTEYSTGVLPNGDYNWFVIAMCDNGDWRQSSNQFSFEIDNSSIINTDLLYSAVNDFPNPAKRIINIQTGEKEFEVELINHLGSVIFKEINTSEINVSEIKTGSYILIFNVKTLLLTKNNYKLMFKLLRIPSRMISDKAAVENRGISLVDLSILNEKYTY
jgi:hypothetical protein